MSTNDELLERQPVPSHVWKRANEIASVVLKPMKDKLTRLAANALMSMNDLEEVTKQRDVLLEACQRETEARTFYEAHTEELRELLEMRGKFDTLEAAVKALRPQQGLQIDGEEDA